MFLGLDIKNESSLAAIDDNGGLLTYGDLCGFAEEVLKQINKRTLVFVLSENNIGALAAYAALLSASVVPLLLNSTISRTLLKNLINIYKPEYLWVPVKHRGDFDFDSIYTAYNFVLLKTGFDSPEMHDELALLLTTSGTTGSPKLVRHSYRNIEQNAINVSAFFELNESERPIVILPLHYTMGLSVATSHLYSGSTLLLTSSTLTQKAFWEFLKTHKATSFTGVPYSYEVLKKLRFFRMDLPHLNILAQGGGKLANDLFREYAEYAETSGKKFFATYGQTEGTARMSYLSPKKAIEKIGSIGKAIPGGQLSLQNDDGRETFEGEGVGELIYRGPNVTLGYAEQISDLKRGNERNGVLQTGDIAKRDKEGYYYIIGRKARFLKLYGLRVSLDETELLIKNSLGIECACTGKDDNMKVFITEKQHTDVVRKHISQTTGLHESLYTIHTISEMPKSSSGKVEYDTLGLK